MKTILHVYSIDTSTPVGANAYKDLAERLRATPGRGRVMCSWGGQGHYDFVRALDGKEITLETNFLFENQWNTAPIPGTSEQGLRVFDWAEDYFPAEGAYSRRNRKQGHYLDITAEMRDIRRNTHTCGYCGAHEPAAKGYVFCPHCLGSDYLKVEDLPLTRMLSVDESFGAKRAPLTAGERAHLLPQYKEAQLFGRTERDKKRIAQERAKIKTDYTQTVADAKEKHDAAVWIMDRVPGMLSNWLFYTHTGKHCFGWRKPLESETLEGLLEVISDFPFAYEIKCADGRTLNGD